jgi:hypothetical protein
MTGPAHVCIGLLPLANRWLFVIIFAHGFSVVDTPASQVPTLLGVYMWATMGNEEKRQDCCE